MDFDELYIVKRDTSSTLANRLDCLEVVNSVPEAEKVGNFSVQEQLVVLFKREKFSA